MMDAIEQLLIDLKIAGLVREHRKLQQLIPLFTRKTEDKPSRAVRERTQEIDIDKDVDMWRPRETLRTKIQPPMTYERPLKDKTMLGKTAITGKDIQQAFGHSAFAAFRFDPDSNEMKRTSSEVVPGISVTEYRKQKIVKGVNKPTGPSSYVVVVYTGKPGARRMQSPRLSLREAVEFIKQHAEQAAAAVAAEE